MGPFGRGKSLSHREIHYRLVESRIRVRGTSVTSENAFAGTVREVRDVHVEVVHGAGEQRQMRTGIGTQDISVTLAADGRLQTLEYKRTGAGPAVVAAGAKLIGFIAGTALSVVTRAATGGFAGEGAEPPTPRTTWAADHKELAALLARNQEVVTRASTQLADLRAAVVTTSETTALRALAARIGACVEVADAARAEVARIEAAYLAWLAGITTVTTASLECFVDLLDVAVRAPGAAVTVPPAPPDEGALGYGLWRDFRAILEVVDARRAEGAPPVTHTSGSQAVPADQAVTWRVPRSVELWIWSQSADVEELSLVSRSTVTVVDQGSDTHSMELRGGAFGEHGGTWSFGEAGAPTAVKTSDASMASSLANTLGGVPAQLVEAVDQAKKLNDAVYGIQDSAAERQKVAAERDLAHAKARVELLGIDATAEDAAAVARAEQAVKLRTATRAVSADADALDDLKADLDRVKTQNDLDAARRAAQNERALAEIKVEVARLEQEVLAAQAAYDRDHAGERRD